MSGIVAIDLFAGAGGLTLGTEMAGVPVALSVDNDGPSCQTLSGNGGHHEGAVLQADVVRLSGEELRSAAGITSTAPLIVVGGPPCQPFSKAAYWTDSGHEAYRRSRARGESTTRPASIPTARSDPRRSLVSEFLRLIVESRAEGFLFENVPSILHPRNKHVIAQFMSDAQSSGFKVTMVVANAADFGVAQTRQRVFVMGSRRSVPMPPAPTHSERPLDASVKPWVGAGQALSRFSGPRFREDGEDVHGRWASHLAEVPISG